MIGVGVATGLRIGGIPMTRVGVGVAFGVAVGFGVAGVAVGLAARSSSPPVSSSSPAVVPVPTVSPVPFPAVPVPSAVPANHLPASHAAAAWSTQVYTLFSFAAIMPLMDSGSATRTIVDALTRAIRLMRAEIETTQAADVDDRLILGLENRLLALSSELSARYFNQDEAMSEIAEGLG